MNKKIVLFLLIIPLFLSAKQYKGAELRTFVSFQYGRFEVRMKSVQASGMLSSFFTFHDGPNLPANWNEIDIEILGRYSDEVQFNVISQGQVNHVWRQDISYNPHETFHVYAIEWTPDYIAWFVDGYEIYRQTGDHIDNLYFGQKLMMNIWPPDYPDWVGTFNPGVLPLFAYYDWVRYYAYTPGTGDNFSLQWEDQFDSWDQVRWGKGTHTWVGNNCDFVKENAVFQDGYFILCLTDDSNTGYSGDPVVDIDADPPYLVYARGYIDYIDVFFSEELDPTSATTTGNYIIPGVSIDSAYLKDDNRTVRLSVNGMTPGISYNLIVSGIKDRAQPANISSLMNTIIGNPLDMPLEINVAGNSWQTYTADQIWEFSREFGRTGGQTTDHGSSAQFQGTDEDNIYQKESRGITFYNIRVADGIYRLTLMFAETEYNAVNQRVFDVFAENQLIIDDLDIYNETGGYHALEIVSGNFEVNDGILEIYFSASQGEPVLSGLIIEQISMTGMGSNKLIPEEFNWRIAPNPFNPSTNISYNLRKSANVNIDVYAANGSRVYTLINENQAVGKHSFQFIPENLSSGVYFLRFNKNGLLVDTKKAVYLK